MFSTYFKRVLSNASSHVSTHSSPLTVTQLTVFQLTVSQLTVSQRTVSQLTVSQLTARPAAFGSWKIAERGRHVDSHMTVVFEHTAVAQQHRRPGIGAAADDAAQSSVHVRQPLEEVVDFSRLAISQLRATVDDARLLCQEPTMV
jgi:hypothetical protein